MKNKVLSSSFNGKVIDEIREMHRLFI